MRVDPAVIFNVLRVPQYLKNLFILLPLFFSGRMNEWQLLGSAIWVALGFSFCASAIYIFNDLMDVERDRRHPSKRNRPIAAGRISPLSSKLLMLVLLSAGLTVIASQSYVAAIVSLSYVLLNILYSLWLKQIAIVDVSVIALGFVIRLMVGAVASGISLSQWIVIMTYLLALFLALAKRRDDVLIHNATGEKMRDVIDGYNLAFLDSSMNIMGAIVIVSYVMYTVSPEAMDKFETGYLYLTAIFVVLGIMRYLQISMVKKESGRPTRILLNDRPIQLSLLAWVGSYVWFLYA